MATNPAEAFVYPFSTRDKESIPLDIIDPLILQRLAISSGGQLDATIGADVELASIYCAIGCLLQFGTPTITYPANGVSGSDGTCLFIPPGCIITAKITPGAVRAVSLNGATTVYIQQIRKWAALGLAQQVSNISR